jgi:methionyl-tRNA synthetase
MKKTLITTPIYYVNDKPHIGHAYTTLAADVLTRFFREQTTDKIHEENVKSFLNKLKEKNLIYEKEYQGLYCTECEKFLTERDLVNGLCPDHKTKPKKVSEKNWFFKLNLKLVKELIDTGQLKIGPQSAKNEVLGLLKQGLDDFSISRQKDRVKWGIELPFDKNQTVYVWIDALLNYITGDDSDNFKKYWKDGYVIHLLAKDILKFHTIYWPAVLKEVGYKVPDEEFIHGFFTIDNQKMSKTLGNVIDPNEIVKKFGVDGARYLMLSQFPFGQDGDVKESKFVEKYNADLANGLGNLVSRVLTLTAKINLKVLNARPDKDILNRTKQARDNYTEYMEDFKLFEALEEIWKLIGFCDEYIDKEKPWQLKDKKKLEQVLSNLLYCISEIANLIEPFLPETSEKIKKQLKSNKSKVLFPRI